MQSLREEMHANAKKNREDLDELNDEFKQNLTILNEEKRAKERRLRDEHTERQHAIERKMNDLKLQWVQEHPFVESKIIE